MVGSLVPVNASVRGPEGGNVKRLKEARIRHVVPCNPWLNLLDLPGAA